MPDNARQLDTRAGAQPSLRERATPRFLTVGVLGLLIIVCAAVNLTKPVHIDDAAYLEIVHWIVVHPLHPMIGLLNWTGAPEPIASVNQPHLYFYLEALVQILLGDSLLAQHGLMALMSATVVIVFYQLALILIPQRALFYTALFVLGPVFLPGQNIMVDVPTLACWLICFWALLGPPNRQTTRRLIIGAVAIAAASLIKYTSLVLLPVFALTLLLRRQWRPLWVLMIPIGALAAWSLFNYLDYGGVHVLTRGTGSYSPRQTFGQVVNWLAGLGAVAPFTVMFVPLSFKGRLRWTLPVSILAGGAAYWVSYYHYGAHSVYSGLAWALLVGNGCFALALVTHALARGKVALVAWAKRGPIPVDYSAPSSDDSNFVLVLWLVGAAAFVVLFAPFLAIRHVLLSLPALLLLLGHAFEPNPYRNWQWASLVITAFLGLWLALSDYSYALVYPVYATKIEAQLPAGVTHWYLGHWGWQWYARTAGMVQYETARTVMTKGDYVVAPKFADKESLSPKEWRSLQIVKTIEVPSGPLTWLRTMALESSGGYYAYSIKNNQLPWTLSLRPLEIFTLYQVN